MFDKKMKNIADAVNQILGLEEIDPKKRTKDTLKGADEPTKQKDDVGPGSDGKSTKVKFRPGPLTTEGFKDKLFDRLYNHLDEASEELLARYMKSRGYNPTTTPKDKKIAITKSNEFKKWVADHQFEEAGYEDYSEEQLDEMINEVLGKDATAGDWIHDFVHSDDPKFAGKSKKKRQQMALAAYYAKQRNEEAELDLDEAQPFFQEELEQFMQSEEFSELDEDSQNELKSYLFDENTEPKSDKEKKLASLAHPKDKITFKDVLVGRGVLKKEEVESQDVAEDVKDPQPVTTGHFADKKYTDKGLPKPYPNFKNIKTGKVRVHPKNKEQGVVEGKHPESDTVPFVEPYHKAEPDVKDKGTGGTHTPMSRAKHLARIALKKVKNEVLGKAGMTSEEAESLDEKIDHDTLNDIIKTHGFTKASKAIQKVYNDGHISKKQADKHMSYLNSHPDKVGQAKYAVEEVEQIDEISADLASRYLSKKRERDYVQTGPHTSQRKEPQTMDQAFKDGKNTVRALKRIGDLRKFGKKAK